MNSLFCALVVLVNVSEVIPISLQLSAHLILICIGSFSISVGKKNIVISLLSCNEIYKVWELLSVA